VLTKDDESLHLTTLGDEVLVRGKSGDGSSLVVLVKKSEEEKRARTTGEVRKLRSRVLRLAEG